MIISVGGNKRLLEKLDLLLQSRCYCPGLFLYSLSQLLKIKFSHPRKIVSTEIFLGQIHEIKKNVKQIKPILKKSTVILAFGNFMIKIL